MLIFVLGLTLSARPSNHIPLYGNSTLGYYFVEAQVGSLKQSQSLIVDTGSFSTVFVCEGCSVCNKHKDLTFNSKNSTTFQKLEPSKPVNGWDCSQSTESKSNECTYEQSYLEGSTYSGFYASDSFIFENETFSSRILKNYTHTFGCAMKETNEFFRQEVNGIIGLGQRRDPKSNPPTIIELAKSEGRIESRSFSICLGRNGGTLRLGAPLTDLHLPLAKSRTINVETLRWKDIYVASLSSIVLEGENVQYDFKQFESSPGKVFFDSGTTYTYFSDELFDSWKKSFSDFCKRAPKNCNGENEYKNCYDVKQDNGGLEKFLSTFPPAVFTFNGKVPYYWYPQDYFSDTDVNVCIGIKPLKDLILGANFMRNYDIFFEQETQRITFARANCSRESSITFKEEIQVAKEGIFGTLLILLTILIAVL